MKIENNININNIKNDNKIKESNKVNVSTNQENERNNNEVNISIINQLHKLKNESFDNKEKILKLKNQINSNQYSIDATKLSKKIMDFEIQLQKLND